MLDGEMEFGNDTSMYWVSFDMAAVCAAYD